MSKLSESWDRIVKWMRINAPEILNTLNPGASPSDVDEIQQFLGIKFPDSVRELYLICNGQHTKSYSFLPHFYFLLPLSEMRENWEIETHLLMEDPELGVEIPFDNDNETLLAASPKARACYWHVKWIPFAYCLTGDLYCLDFAPTPQGQDGQIIEFWHNADMRNVIASSAEDLFSNYADDLENGLYVYDLNASCIEKKSA
jgi:cell wall assembly regulator SMI1